MPFLPPSQQRQSTEFSEKILVEIDSKRHLFELVVFVCFFVCFTEKFVVPVRGRQVGWRRPRGGCETLSLNTPTTTMTRWSQSASATTWWPHAPTCPAAGATSRRWYSTTSHARRPSCLPRCSAMTSCWQTWPPSEASPSEPRTALETGRGPRSPAEALY